MRWRAFAALCALALPTCRTLEAPQEVGRAYAQALREGRIEDAYGLTSVGYRLRVNPQQFKAHYHDAAQRSERAAAIDAAVALLRAQAPPVVLVLEADGWRVEEAVPTVAGPALILEHFVDALDRGDFSAAYGLLSASWRARYTPERFKDDFDREPLAKERLERARRALATPAQVRAGGADFPLGDGKAVRLVLEGDEYRLAALE